MLKQELMGDEILGVREGKVSRMTLRHFFLSR